MQSGHTAAMFELLSRSAGVGERRLESSSLPYKSDTHYDLRKQAMQPSYATNLRHQQRRKERFYRYIIIHKLGVGRYICRGLELTGTFRAGPEIHNMILVYIFRPFGSDQRIAALSAGHSVVGAACGRYDHHDDLNRNNIESI
jgi:hypothetical protein